MPSLYLEYKVDFNTDKFYKIEKHSEWSLCEHMDENYKFKYCKECGHQKEFLESEDKKEIKYEDEIGFSLDNSGECLESCYYYDYHVSLDIILKQEEMVKKILERRGVQYKRENFQVCIYE
jgi:hypothetical protein